MQILLVPGSLRPGSTNAAALDAVSGLEVPGATFDRYAGLSGLPHFDPDADVDPLHPAVAELRRRIAEADAVLFSTPEYAGTLPGSFKNLLDWTVGGGEIYEKPVAWVNVAAAGRAMGAHETLRLVLGYVGARIVEGACADVPVPRDAVDGGKLVDPKIRDQLADVVRALLAYSG
ncbi:MAG: NADPH-dependent reductase [Actinomycetia bacterium]|nr:NADPH-dependent reductase [Actinomycetes bacterium]